MSLFHLAGSSQSTAWIAGNELALFTATGIVTEPLPQPGGSGNYSGAVASYNQYVEYSLETGILFFIIDSNIYDREGYLIADSDQNSNCQICLPMSQANVTTAVYSNHCDKFWVFFANNVALLDLSIQNPIHPTRNGYVLDWDDPTVPGYAMPFFENYVDGDLEGFSEFPGNPNIPVIGLNSWPYKILPVADFGGHAVKGILIDLYDDNLSGEKYLAVQSENIPFIYKVDHTGVWLHQQWGNSAYSPGDGLSFHNSIEFTRNASGNVLLAASLTAGTMTITDPNLFIFEADQNFVLQNVTSLSAHIGSVTGAIGDVVFSPNADYIYFGLQEQPYLGYYRISTDTFGDFSSILTNAQAEEAGLSQIEVNQVNGNPVLFFAGPNGISYLTSPDDPTQSQLVYNAIPLSNLGQLNSASTFEDFFFLQHQQYVHSFNEIPDVTDCCVFFAEQVGEDEKRITGTHVWSPGATPFSDEVDGVVYFNENLIFESGSNVAINDLEFRFGPLVKVVVMAGATVELNDSKWTSICDQMWLGTELLGVTNPQHSISQSSGSQGLMRLTDSTIEHARLGIKVGTGPLNSGGILRCYTSTFRNNARDVQFLPYRYVTPGGNLVMNQSVFHNTYFITDAALNYPQVMPSVHVELREVFRIRFEKCSFMNTTPYSTHSWDDRGVGIHAIAASFNLSGSNTEYDPEIENSDATSFYRLQFGIRSTGFNNPLATYRCRYQEFQECAYGIVNFHTDNIEVYENNFSLMTFSPLSGLETMIRGMYLTGSTGYEVQQNYFTFDGVETGTGLGVWVDNSGKFPNQIRNNTFNRLKVGCYVSNVNAEDAVSGNLNGLQLLCNNFSECITDIYRGPQTSMRHNQGGSQIGLFNIYAGNVFSSASPNCAGIEGDFRNHPDQVMPGSSGQWSLDYFCPIGIQNQIPYCEFPTTPVFSVTPVSSSTHVADCGFIFPEYSGVIPPAGGRNQEELILELAESEDEYHELFDYYTSWVDDGVTEASIELVVNAFPNESEFVRDIMLQRLPLSDDVLRTFVAMAQNYDPWHLTQVFLADSPLHPRFLQELEASEVLSPFFMSLITSAQNGEHPRHQLENELSIISANIYDIKKKLGHIWLHDLPDTSATILQFDSLQVYASYPTQALHLAAYELFFGSPSEIEFILAESDEWSNFQLSFSLLETLRDTISYDTLSVTLTLNSMLDSENSSLSSFALAMQHAFFEGDSLPDPVLFFPKSLNHSIGNELEQGNHASIINVYPNPTSQRTMLTYPSELSGIAYLRLYDLKGRRLIDQVLTGSGVLELRLDDLSQGLYIIHVISNEKVVGQTRVTIQH